MDFRQGASDSDNPQPAGQSATRPIVDPGPEPGLRDVLGSLWLQALRNYKAKTGVDPLEDRLLKDLAGRNDVKGILEVFDRRMRDFKEFRASDTKWGKLRDKYLIPAVHTVLTLTDALAEVASFFPVVPGGKAIFVAFGALLAATEGVSNRYDALLELFEEVPFFLEGVDVRASEPQNWGTPTRSVAIAILVQLLDIFSLAIQTTSGPWRRLVQYRKSLVGSTDMQKALAHMKGLTVLETRAMASETRVIVANVQREIQDLLSANDAYAILLKDVVGKLEDANHQVADEYGQIRAGRIREQQELEQIRRSQAEAAEEATLARLQRLDVADLTSQARSGCLEGTRLTVLSDLDAWSREPDAPRVYWVNGMAGTGKSAIARTFGRRLYDAKMLGGSFFCSRESNVEQQNAKRIIPTLAAALAGRYMKYRSALVKSLMASAAEPSPGFWGVAEQIQRLLVEPFACFVDDEYPCFVLVVDALDETESGTAQELVQLLVDNSKRLPLKFFLTSRPEIHLRRHLDSLDASLRLHDIAKETVTSDINLYVSCRMHDIRGRFESVKIDLPTGWPSSSDVRMLADLSDRLFIHAFTTTEYIGGGDPVQRLQDVLSVGHDSSPRSNPLKDLDRIYDFILASGPEGDDERMLIRRILTAMLVVYRPLTSRGMSVLLGIQVYQLKIALLHLHAVINVPEDDDGTLATFHASFGDFLTSRAPDGMSICPVQGHHDVLSRCLTIMCTAELHFNMSEAQTSYLPNAAQRFIPAPAHVEYACTFWLDHMLMLDGLRDASGSQSSCLDMAPVFLQLEGVLSYKLFFWLEMCSMQGICHSLKKRFHDLLQSQIFVSAPRSLQRLFYDILTILKGAGEALNFSAPHVYMSIIPYIKPDSLLGTRMAGLFSRLPSHNLIPTAQHTETVHAVAFSPDGSQFISYPGHNNCITRWQTDTGELLQSLMESPEVIAAIAYSWDGYHVASISAIGSLCIWRSDSLASDASFRMVSRVSLRTFPQYVGLSFLKTGLLAVMSLSGILLWPLYPPSGPQGRWSPFYPAVAVAVSSDGSLFAMTLDNGDTLVRTRRGSLKFELKARTLCVGRTSISCDSLVFSPDDSRLIAHDRYDEVRIWSMRTGDLIRELCRTTDRGHITSIAVSDRHIALAYSSAILLYNDTIYGKMQRRITGINSDIKCLGFSSDGSRLLSGSVDGSINVWSINSEDCLKVMDDRFNHFYLPGAAQGHRQPASDWLRGSQGELLLFVPKELQGYFQHPPCQMRMSGYRFTINWDGAVHGKDWTRCYVGPHLMELIYPSRRLSATQK